MADNKSKRGAADRRQIAAGEGYEVNYFAKKHGISKDQAQKLIAKVGANREKLNAAAEKLKPASVGAKVVKAAGDAVKSAVKAGKAALPKAAAAKKR